MYWSETLLRCPDEGSAFRVAVRELIGASADIQAPVRPDHIEDGPVQLHGLVFEGACAGVEDGFDGRGGEASSGDSAVACPLESAPLRYESQRVATPTGAEGVPSGLRALGVEGARAEDSVQRGPQATGLFCFQELWGHVAGSVKELRALHRLSKATASQPDREYEAVAHEGSVFL